MSDIKNAIINELADVQSGNKSQVSIFKADAASSKANNFVFFIKPELTIESSTLKFDQVLELIFAQLDQYGVDINEVQILGAKYLDENNIMAQHYGVINAVSTDPMNMSDDAKKKFVELFGAFEDNNVKGGVQYIKENPSVTPAELDGIWMQSPSERLAGGTYAAKVNIDGTDTVLLNGFHPSQLAEFIQPGKSIVIFNASSDSNWDALRGKMIGATNPEKAEAGSLRNQFLVQKDALGIEQVSQGYNGVHLSAGPLEGLVELVRFFGGESTDYPFGKALAEQTGDKAAQLLANEDLNQNGEHISAFDATEEMNATAAIEVLAKTDLA